MGPSRSSSYQVTAALRCPPWPAPVRGQILRKAAPWRQAIHGSHGRKRDAHILTGDSIGSLLELANRGSHADLSACHAGAQRDSNSASAPKDTEEALRGSRGRITNADRSA